MDGETDEDRGLKFEVFGTLNPIRIRIPNFALFSQVPQSRATVRGKENRHETHSSRESFPVSLCGTWC